MLRKITIKNQEYLLKTFTKSLVAGALISAAAFSSAAMAEQKIGAVNVQGIFQSMPQAATIQQDLAAEFKDQTEEVSRLEKDIKYYQEKKQRDGSLMSAKDIEELDTQIATLYQDYQAKGKAFQQATGLRKNEETNKIIALVRQAIDSIAAKDKYDLILEQQAVIFAKPDAMITNKVVEQVSKLN